ncbi:hypothetical protein IW261DRAFT_1414828 [Armillaria novae-zelandiae]|uniref:Uncharacterized protein n=1 Tax=Armillaria novae-zelandiae TaxID=153914 RepID=A0AA39PMI0_9AGAR|nr:hypothetical protein IW261DRAFT_1414828 [Armillaria novae-zelandiae]
MASEYLGVKCWMGLPYILMARLNDGRNNEEGKEGEEGAWEGCSGFFRNLLAPLIYVVAIKEKALILLYIVGWPWCLDALGNYVWVLVSAAGIVFQEEDKKGIHLVACKGELVLVIEKVDLDLSYWPSKVLEYVPPVLRNQKAGKYKVLYLDGMTQTIPRTWFHCLGEGEFGTCKCSHTVGVLVPSLLSQPLSTTRYVRQKYVEERGWGKKVTVKVLEMQANSLGFVAEPFLPSPSEEPPPSSLAPLIGDVDIKNESILAGLSDRSGENMFQTGTHEWCYSEVAEMEKNASGRETLLLSMWFYTL